MLNHLLDIWNLKKGDDIRHISSTGYVMHQQFNIQQFYILPTNYLRVLY